MFSKIKKFFKNLFEDETSKQIDATMKEIKFKEAQLSKRANAWRDENHEYLDSMGEYLKECEEWFKEQERLASEEES